MGIVPPEYYRSASQDYAFACALMVGGVALIAGAIGYVIGYVHGKGR